MSNLYSGDKPLGAVVISYDVEHIPIEGSSKALSSGGAFNAFAAIDDKLNKKPDSDSVQPKLTGAEGQMVGFDAEGNAVAQDMPATGGGDWQLLDKIERTAGGKYTTGSNGTFTWTAPDLANGADYEIGVYMIGGGASGGVVLYYNDEEYGYTGYAVGGASGYGRNKIMTVTPGQTYAAVVGAGGAAASLTGTSSGYAWNTTGKAGGTTSFNGTTAAGGSAGTSTINSNLQGADGGQGSASPYYTGQTTELIAGTVLPTASATGKSQSPAVSQNWFDTTMITLACGGAARATLGGTSAVETVTALPDGTGGGSGSNSATGKNATGYGNGGGGTARINSYATTKSGAGSAGVIFIYTKEAIA